MSGEQLAHARWGKVRDRTIADRRSTVAQRDRSIRERQQILIDAEVRATRRELLRDARRRGGRSAAALFDPEFLSVADEPTIVQSILNAAGTLGAADACDLQLHNPLDGTLRIHAQHGFTAAFLAAFRTIPGTARTSCAAALTAGEPVLVHDVVHSPIFAGAPTLPPLRDAGIRAVASYPLRRTENGPVFGILSFHFRLPGLDRGDSALVALGANLAFAHLPPR